MLRCGLRDNPLHQLVAEFLSAVLEAHASSSMRSLIQVVEVHISLGDAKSRPCHRPWSQPHHLAAGTLEDGAEGLVFPGAASRCRTHMPKCAPLAEKLLEVPQELVRAAIDLELREGNADRVTVAKSPMLSVKKRRRTIHPPRPWRVKLRKRAPQRPHCILNTSDGSAGRPAGSRRGRKACRTSRRALGRRGRSGAACRRTRGARDRGPAPPRRAAARPF